MFIHIISASSQMTICSPYLTQAAWRFFESTAADKSIFSSHCESFHTAEVNRRFSQAVKTPSNLLLTPNIHLSLCFGLKMLLSAYSNFLQDTPRSFPKDEDVMIL